MFSNLEDFCFLLVLLQVHSWICTWKSTKKRCSSPTDNSWITSQNVPPSHFHITCFAVFLWCACAVIYFCIIITKSFHLQQYTYSICDILYITIKEYLLQNMSGTHSHLPRSSLLSFSGKSLYGNPWSGCKQDSKI